MGIAIIAKDADFSSNNLGTVTPATTVGLSSISIDGPSVVEGTAQYTPIYSPANTTQRGVTWSVESGSQYATINANTGVLNTLPGADNNSVTIKVTSTVDSTISATKTITVTTASVTYTLSELNPDYKQSSWMTNNTDNTNVLEPNKKAYWHILAGDQTKVGSNISAVKGSGDNYGAWLILKVPIPDGSTVAVTQLFKSSSDFGVAATDNNDTILSLFTNTTVTTGNDVTINLPTGAKYFWMPITKSMYEGTNNGANFTLTFM